MEILESLEAHFKKMHNTVNDVINSSIDIDYPIDTILNEPNIFKKCDIRAFKGEKEILRDLREWIGKLFNNDCGFGNAINWYYDDRLALEVADRKLGFVDMKTKETTWYPVDNLDQLYDYYVIDDQRHINNSIMN
jgi:hypothetical protein